MVTSTSGETYSSLAIHPGELLTEELAEREKLTQRELAAMMGRPVQAVNAICRGRKAVTADTAVALERTLGSPARLWLNMQVEYALTLAYQRAEASSG